MPIITQLTCEGNQTSGNTARWETHKLMSYHITTECGDDNVTVVTEIIIRIKSKLIEG